MLMISRCTLTHVRSDLYREYLLIEKEIINYHGKVSYIRMKETPRMRITVTSSLN
jgi:hypothetical protein